MLKILREHIFILMKEKNKEITKEETNKDNLENNDNVKETLASLVSIITKESQIIFDDNGDFINLIKTHEDFQNFLLVIYSMGLLI
jgi:hypothetical protein